MVLRIVTVFGYLVVTLTMSAFAAQQPSDPPEWLKIHVGDEEGQISLVVLARARALYLAKVKEGHVINPCYFAMDATRPHDLGNGKLGRRFYIICESSHSYRAISAGHGGGRKLKGILDFSNGRRCAKNFGNAMDSQLTAGGAYETAEEKTSFKGYYRTSTGKLDSLMRTFIQFEGKEEIANARERKIGGHAAIVLKNVCLRKDTVSPYADGDGYVPFGQLVNYSGGRSNGCTSWSPSDARKIVKMIRNDPTTLYIYPEAADIDTVAKLVSARGPLQQARVYWNATCLKEIGSPHYWSTTTLEPILAQYQKDHLAPPPRPLPICKAP